MSATLSVVICTHNRCKVLRTCLESVVSQKCDPWTFEIIVVDNASRDATKDVVKDFSSLTVPIRYVYEERLGVSRARATGARHAKGRYVAYLDDDTVAYPGWCLIICQTFESVAGDRASGVVALGGPVEPVFEASRPSWLTPDLESLYAILDFGDEMKPFPRGFYPLGANMAFRRETLEEHPWDEKLRMCEESELFGRLASYNYAFLYVPAMRIRHFIQASRCTVDWLLRRYRADGQYQVRIRHAPWVKARLAIVASIGLIRSAFLLTFGFEQRKLFRQCEMQFHIGILQGLIKSYWSAGEDPDRARPYEST